MSITVKQLKNQIGVSSPHPILYCNHCQSEYSANVGDYFMERLETVLVCCGKPLTLVTKQTVYKKVKP